MPAIQALTSPEFSDQSRSFWLLRTGAGAALVAGARRSHPSCVATILMVALIIPLALLFPFASLAEGTSSATLAVFAPLEITYSGGVCSIDSRRDEERKVTLSVTCRFRSGAVSGADIVFEPREGGGLHMTQRDGTFETDLYKCPG